MSDGTFKIQVGNMGLIRKKKKFMFLMKCVLLRVILMKLLSNCMNTDKILEN